MNGTETRGHGRHDGMDHEAGPAEIERDLARTRSELNDTLRAIERRFSREELVDQALDYLRGGPREFAVNLRDQAKENPFPVVLAAVGIGWLMFANRRAASPPPEYTSEGLEEPGPGRRMAEKGKESYGKAAEKGRETMEQAKEAYGKAAERGRESYEGMKERGREAWESVAESLHEAGEAVKEKSEDLREAAGEKFEQARAATGKSRRGLRFRARSVASGMRRGSEGTASGIRQSGEITRVTFSNLLREQPLTLAALGIALGAGLAAGLPTTRRERETFGPARDETVNRAREVGREQMEKTRADLKQAVSEPPPHPGPN